MEQQEYLLEMRNMSKSFPGVKALDNVNLLVRPGSVHALVGENGAGKSTLMKCLFGIYHQNEGRILLHGKEVFIQTPHNALMNGVAMVHQELEQVHERNVMDNIWLGRYPKNFLTVNEKKMYLDTSVIFKSLDIQIDPKEKLKNLSVSQRQMVDIAKSFSYNSNIFVMDEPTSSLTETEVEHLFRIIKTLKEKGSSIIYISHKLSEIFNVADEVTILRDGKWVETAKVKEITSEKLISLMVGRTLDNLYPPKDNIPGKTILKIEGLSEKAKNSIIDIAFDLKEGEILGIAGLMGSRRTELVETIFGIREKTCGEIYLEGKLINNKNSEYAIKNGFALCTEERRFNGIFPGLSVSFNSTIANIKKYSNRIGALNNNKIARDTKWVIDNLNVKTPSQKVPIRLLSGGNQQKVIIGKWLLLNSKILLMDEPTRGIDVGAKYEIYKLMIELTKEGKSIIFVSSEMSELIGISDRILVMSNGRIADIYDLNTNRELTTQENILRSAAKYL